MSNVITENTAIAPAKKELKSTLGITSVKTVKHVKQRDPVTKKPLLDAEKKQIVKDETSTFGAAVATGQQENACQSAAGFVAFVKQYLDEGVEAIEGFFDKFLHERGFIDLFEDATQISITKGPDGRETVNKTKYINGLFHGVPRSANTINSVKASLAKAKEQYGELQMAKDTFPDRAELLANIQTAFGINSIEEFSLRFVALRDQVKAQRNQLKALEEAKAARDAAKAKAALEAPVAPKA